MARQSASPASLSAEERRLRSRLHQLLRQAEGFLHASLIEMARRCGNPRCRCASDDARKHRSLYLAQSRGGKTVMAYVPKDQEQAVRRRHESYQQASSLLEALSEQGWRRLARAKAKAQAERKAARKKAAKRKAAAKKSPSATPRRNKRPNPPSGPS